MKRPNRAMPGTPDLLDSLSYAKTTLPTLKNLGRPYDTLIDAILAFPDPDSNVPLPKLKDIQQQLGVAPIKLRKWIEQLHADFIALIESESAVMTFKTTRVCFLAKGPYKDAYLCFYCRIPQLPRIGEEVKLGFVTSAVSSGVFYVEGIENAYKNDEVEVTISLTTFRPMITELKNRAIYERRLDYDDLEKMSEYELEEFLRSEYGRYGNR